jgi:hypothetical protein
MNNEKYNQIIGVAYDEYCKWYSHVDEKTGNFVNVKYPNSKSSKEEFINQIKIDEAFSEKWGLKIEERVLSTQERADIYYKSNYAKDTFPTNDNGWNNLFDGFKIPTKLISITYKETKIENYE